jgi:hypothetical protein
LQATHSPLGQRTGSCWASSGTIIVGAIIAYNPGQGRRAPYQSNSPTQFLMSFSSPCTLTCSRLNIVHTKFEPLIGWIIPLTKGSNRVEDSDRNLSPYQTRSRRAVCTERTFVWELPSVLLACQLRSCPVAPRCVRHKVQQ